MVVVDREADPESAPAISMLHTAKANQQRILAVFIKTMPHRPLWALSDIRSLTIYRTRSEMISSRRLVPNGFLPAGEV